SSCDSEGYSKKKPFEAYQDKIIQLCRDLGWGEPSTVERMKGGSYNRIVGLTFKERQPSGFVLRISRTGGEFDEAAEVKDQVSLLQYLSTHLPVAGISAFDSSQNNALSSSYVLQEYWDLILSLPLVLARSPPLWLWCNEDERSDGWTGNMDVAPARELTQEELLIKAHFDQIMAKHDPSYMEDAYYRGPWLRRLARFALFGFGEYGSFDRYDNFIKEWEIHYSSITKFEVENISNNESDEESGEDEE
ncbi:uncharacterized protein LY89DRAFT_552679, partial [Mollisia scopiformis]